MNLYSSFKRHSIYLLVIFAVILNSCNLPARATTSPTLDVTQAYQTVEARLTEAISRTPAVSPTQLRVTHTPAEAIPPPTEVIETATQDRAQTPSATCDQALPGFPIDVTIPDDTVLQPGERFTKTWRLQNAGTCTWTTDYDLVWFSGEQLDAPLSIPLSGNTDPGQSVDLSVEMKAPDTEGTYQSWWKLRNPSGVLFGIGPNSDAAFWVRFVTEGVPVLSVTPTITETIGPTTTPTPGIQVSGSATLQFGDLFDLDHNDVNISGADLTYEELDQIHNLVPIDNTEMSVIGPNEPSLSNCQDMNLSSDPISVDNLIGNYICYRTNMALPGWMLINSIDPETGNLNVEIFTWLIP